MEILQQVIKFCGKEEKLLLGAISPLFHNNFNITLTSGVKLHFHFCEIWLLGLFFLISAHLICRGTDISKYFSESLGLWDNESWLYGVCFAIVYSLSLVRLVPPEGCASWLWYIVFPGSHHIYFGQLWVGFIIIKWDKFFFIYMYISR